MSGQQNGIYFRAQNVTIVVPWDTRDTANGCCHPQSTINQIAHSSSKACHTAQSREKTVSRTPYFGLDFTVKDVIGSVHVSACNGAIFTPWSVVKPYLSLHRKVI